MKAFKKPGTYTVIKDDNRFYVEDWLYQKVAGPFKRQDDAYLCAKNNAWISVVDDDDYGAKADKKYRK